MGQILEPLPPMWEVQMGAQAPGSDLVWPSLLAEFGK